MVIASILAFVLTFAISLPVDWARRRGTALLAGIGAALNVAAIMSAVFNEVFYWLAPAGAV